MVCGIRMPRAEMPIPPKSASWTGFCSSPTLRSWPRMAQCTCAKRAASSPPSTPIAPPIMTSEADDAPNWVASSVPAFKNVQIGPISNPAKPRNTIKQQVPESTASMACSVNSMPNLWFTSSAKSDPPRGTPKNAASAHAIPHSVYLRTSSFSRTPAPTRASHPATDAQIATKGASGPSDPPPRIENCDASVIGIACSVGTYAFACT
mmetsp:Transcript_15646/g.38729  ORF Transcript_15646/g.38729 Transcript_15646/m.38729 type:complete len:207 (-) Transcript_15646:266-886(-)